ncbi:MAG: hypothetical protein WC477_04890 [Patescibacteria group bacterium]
MRRRLQNHETLDDPINALALYCVSDQADTHERLARNLHALNDLLEQNRGQWIILEHLTRVETKPATSSIQPETTYAWNERSYEAGILLNHDSLIIVPKDSETVCLHIQCRDNISLKIKTDTLRFLETASPDFASVPPPTLPDVEGTAHVRLWIGTEAPQRLLAAEGTNKKLMKEAVRLRLEPRNERP